MVDHIESTISVDANFCEPIVLEEIPGDQVDPSSWKLVSGGSQLLDLIIDPLFAYFHGSSLGGLNGLGFSVLCRGGRNLS